jgi:hypothetical protein
VICVDGCAENGGDLCSLSVNGMTATTLDVTASDGVLHVLDGFLVRLRCMLQWRLTCACSC